MRGRICLTVLEIKNSFIINFTVEKKKLFNPIKYPLNVRNRAPLRALTILSLVINYYNT